MLTLQKKFWTKLNAQQKVAIMEILFSILDFAASYNSFSNLRLRMHQIPADRLVNGASTLKLCPPCFELVNSINLWSFLNRPPLNLLRQELAGTCIYLDILQKTTATDMQKEKDIKEDKIEGIAEGKLVSFCEQVLRDASEFQSSMEETSNMDVHRVLELRSPIIIKVRHS